ncbi:hypothetical protein [Metabacillus malikii]|uniref:Multisubunit Na+/H+ antiporter MnhE subunit n=1 Tax=Metabacillus malikii TaxID=1504265 RepID=A0ABT9ZHE7_9BACI|nr:hypothetical protein [Metabacillus malikii]MDQ0231717.1 multisubunit Na+/H+ antiporter MnhE subunit [Metabacillus malikii]
MGPIQGLLKKDFRISRSEFITSLVIYGLAWIAGFSLSSYFNQPVGTLPVFIMSALSMVIYTPIMIFAMLKIEGKTQIWLYSPRSSLALLLSKFVTSLSYQAIVQVLLSIYGAISLYWFGREVYEQLGIPLFIEALLYLNLILLLFGFFFGCWVCFYWTLYHSLASKQIIKPIRWLIMLAIYFFYNLFESFIARIPFIKELISKYEVHLITSPNLELKEANWTVYFDEGVIPVVPFLYYALLSIILIFIAAKLLTKRVEV